MTLYETTGRWSTPRRSKPTPEQQQLQGLKDELSNALAVLSPTNPRIKLLEAQIAALETTV